MLWQDEEKKTKATSIKNGGTLVYTHVGKVFSEDLGLINHL